MVLRSLVTRSARVLAPLAAAALVACGNDTPHDEVTGNPPDAAMFNTGDGGNGNGYGYGSTGDGGVYDAGPPVCPDSLKRCDQVFSYPFNGETSVELRGDYGGAGTWLKGNALTHAGNAWTATVQIPFNKPVQYKFLVNGTTWVLDPNNPNTATDAMGNKNSLLMPVMCANPACVQPPPPPPGVYDWRDAVIYFAFVDRFNDGNAANNCNVAGTSSTPYTSTNYQGGDWAGITQKITSGYFTDLGVNTLWINVPVKNADNVADPGVTCPNGNCTSDGHMYSGYHGYWPSDPLSTESCFGSPQDLKDMVTAAHTAKIKILFDYAMVHVHTSSPLYQMHQTDGWFTPTGCICGSNSCDNGSWNNTYCWFADYLAHYDYTNAAARTYSVNAAIQLVTQNGNDAFRLDAIKQVDPSWLAALRPAIASQITMNQMPPQRFYMVGETYDFQNRGLIRSMIDSTSQLDGQFDFPLRIRLVEAVLMRSTENMLTPDDLGWSRNAPPGMQGLAQFMDSNDGFYPPDAVMSTFIGNHDLPRSIHYAEDTPFWSNSADDGKGQAWSGQPQTSTNPNAYQRLANAFAVLLTNKGAPLLYYGDEIGLPGAGDPDNRRMMQWSGYTADQQALYARIKALTALRAAHPAFRRGLRTTISATEDVWFFSMQSAPDNDTVWVAINRSDSDQGISGLPGTPLIEKLTRAAVTGTTYTVPARGTAVFASM